MNEAQTKLSLSARQGSILTVGENHTVWAYSGATITATRGSVVYAFVGSTVFAEDGSAVHAYDGAEVFATGTAVVHVAEPGAYVEAGKGVTIRLSSGISALIKAKSQVHVENARALSVEPGWSRRNPSIVCSEGATIFGGTGNTLYIERGALYL